MDNVPSGSFCVVTLIPLIVNVTSPSTRSIFKIKAVSEEIPVYFKVLKLSVFFYFEDKKMEKDKVKILKLKNPMIKAIE